jgi:transcriptional regulator with XRE-family HTH domain
MIAEFDSRFARKIRELRLTKGWKQIDLAEAAKINEGYVSDIEIGICLRKLQLMSKAFDMSPSELLKDL